MNYRHAFHAGGPADVVKHAVLTRILVHLRNKPAAFRVIDTHAGAGLYDLRGRIVRTITLDPLESGPSRVVWDGFDDRGSRVPAGMYVARLTADGGNTATQRFVRF